jgi:DNA-directed RNA polymerase specialized sigma24 family protein
MINHFTDYFPQNEAECRRLVHGIHLIKTQRSTVIEADDTWHAVYLKLAEINPIVATRESLFGLVKITATRRMLDQGRRHTHRKALFDAPETNNTGAENEISWITVDTLPDSAHSPSDQVDLSEQLFWVGLAAAQDPKLQQIFNAIIELVSENENASCANIARKINLPYKTVSYTLTKLRTAVKGIR